MKPITPEQYNRLLTVLGKQYYTQTWDDIISDVEDLANCPDIIRSLEQEIKEVKGWLVAQEIQYEDIYQDMQQTIFDLTDELKELRKNV